MSKPIQQSNRPVAQETAMTNREFPGKRQSPLTLWFLIFMFKFPLSYSNVLDVISSLECCLLDMAPWVAIKWGGQKNHRLVAKWNWCFLNRSRASWHRAKRIVWPSWVKNSCPGSSGKATGVWRRALSTMKVKLNGSSNSNRREASLWSSISQLREHTVLEHLKHVRVLLNRVCEPLLEKSWEKERNEGREISGWQTLSL